MDELRIIGMFGDTINQYKAPENLRINGYFTNLGARYTVIDTDLKLPEGIANFSFDFLTEEQLKTYINNYKRKQKLEKLK